MPHLPTLVILGPSPEGERQRAAEAFISKVQRITREQVKKRLREIRGAARDHHDLYLAQLRQVLGNLPGVTVSFAKDVPEAVGLIRETAGDTRLASINKSSIVVNELRPALRQAGFRTYVRYFSEFEHFEETTFQRNFQDCWSLPGLYDEKGLGGSWDVQQRIQRLSSEGRRDYIAVLGVNAISASDGSVYLLQHMSNISKDLEQAKKIILMVGIEKIVRDPGEALVHAQSMGLFGLESMLLDLAPHDVEKYDFNTLPLAAPEEGPVLHIILYDNGRSALLKGDYRDLFLCIDCRACAGQCPVGQQLTLETGMLYSPKNYLLDYLQCRRASVDGCLHCGRCHIECPVDINIPSLFWKSQLSHYSRQGRGWKKRMLDDPELLAKLGTFAAPLSTWISSIPVSKRLMEFFVGVHRQSHLPAFHRKTLRRWLKEGRHD